MGKASLVIGLVEDTRQQQFVYRFLREIGYLAHQIRFRPVPGGGGSGAHWVLDRYADIVEAYRLRSARAETALVVAIDADDGSVSRRQQQFRDRAARTADERIAHMIPKWSIETWVLCLTGRNVDEDQSYRREPGIEEQIGPAAANFFHWTRPNTVPPTHCIPSLLAAIPEVRRLE
ncbi:MAG: hypothetical protein ABSF64_29380 [Bryobacteraceae bacterium]|jgi:hypothetical protein